MMRQDRLLPHCSVADQKTNEYEPGVARYADEHEEIASTLKDCCHVPRSVLELALMKSNSDVLEIAKLGL